MPALLTLASPPALGFAGSRLNGSESVARFLTSVEMFVVRELPDLSDDAKIDLAEELLRQGLVELYSESG